ncbi:MAG TPA: hypothetical protein VFZ97_06390 [Acidimicrobiales bacterium]
MTLVLSVVAGIVLALLVASLLAVVITAMFGVVIAAVCLPYAAIKAALRKGLSKASAQTSPSPVQSERLAIEVPATQPVTVHARRSIWLRPAGLLFWLGVGVLLDLDGTKSRH